MGPAAKDHRAGEREPRGAESGGRRRAYAVDPVSRDRFTAMSPRTAAAYAPRRARVEARRAAD